MSGDVQCFMCRTRAGDDGSTLLQMIKANERRSKSNVADMLHMRQLTYFRIELHNNQELKEVHT